MLGEMKNWHVVAIRKESIASRKTSGSPGTEKELCSFQEIRTMLTCQTNTVYVLTDLAINNNTRSLSLRTVR